MSIFPSMTVDYLLWKCSFEQFFLWHDRASEKITGKEIKSKVSKITAEEIKQDFVYDEEKQRYVIK